MSAGVADDPPASPVSLGQRLTCAAMKEATRDRRLPWKLSIILIVFLSAICWAIVIWIIVMLFF
jgi:hypothetical protein